MCGMREGLRCSMDYKVCCTVDDISFCMNTDAEGFCCVGLLPPRVLTALSALPVLHCTNAYLVL